MLFHEEYRVSEKYCNTSINQFGNDWNIKINFSQNYFSKVMFMVLARYANCFSLHGNRVRIGNLYCCNINPFLKPYRWKDLPTRKIKGSTKSLAEMVACQKLTSWLIWTTLITWFYLTTSYYNVGLYNKLVIAVYGWCTTNINDICK